MGVVGSTLHPAAGPTIPGTYARVACSPLELRNSIAGDALAERAIASMQTRKSRPRIENAPQLRLLERDFEGEGPTLVTPPRSAPALAAPRQQIAPPNIIPFAKPRAMAAMPASFSEPKPIGNWQQPGFGPWGSGFSQANGAPVL